MPAPPGGRRSMTCSTFHRAATGLRTDRNRPVSQYRCGRRSLLPTHGVRCGRSRGPRRKHATMSETSHGPFGSPVCHRIDQASSPDAGPFVPRRDGYTTFIHGLLDVTDNRVGGEPQPPPDTGGLRRAGHLPGRWPLTRAPRECPTPPIPLRHSNRSGSAMRSPRAGSTGYDHKAMGITARGYTGSGQARHFTELGTT